MEKQRLSCEMFLAINSRHFIKVNILLITSFRREMRPTGPPPKKKTKNVTFQMLHNFPLIYDIFLSPLPLPKISVKYSYFVL